MSQPQDKARQQDEERADRLGIITLLSHAPREIIIKALPALAGLAAAVLVGLACLAGMLFTAWKIWGGS